MATPSAFRRCRREILPRSKSSNSIERSALIEDSSGNHAIRNRRQSMPPISTWQAGGGIVRRRSKTFKLLLNADVRHRFEPGEIEARDGGLELVEADAVAFRAHDEAVAEH